MSQGLVLQLQSAAPCDWAACGLRLSELCGEPALAAAEGVELIRVPLDPEAVDAVLLVRCVDATQLEAASKIIGSWLLEFGLTSTATPIRGDVVFDSARQDCGAAAADPDRRVAQFVETVAKTGEVWSLYDETWARAAVAGHDETLPFWPTADDAANSARAAWRTFAPRAIEIGAFADEWLPAMEEDGISAAVWPSPSEGVAMTARQLAAVLTAGCRSDERI